MKTIEEILKLDDAHRTVVEVPEWDDKITVVSMTADDRANVERKWTGKQASTDPIQFRVDVLTPCLREWASPEQIKLLAGKNAMAVERLFKAACTISGFGQDDLEEERKN